MKTKKWVNAPSYSYEGDDWGEYDEDDEYGVGSPSGAEATSTPTDPQPQGQAQGLTGGTARSFTNPEAQPAPDPRRAPSFNAGDERRAFSGSQAGGQEQAQPLQVQTNVPPETSGNRQASAASFASSQVSDLSSQDPRNRSNYSPSAEPPPLQTRTPSVPQTPSQQPPQTSQEQQRPPVSSAPTSATAPTSAPRLPFVRPADIYKRMEEEREKERRSMDSQRSTSDSTGSQAGLRERSSMDSMGRASGRRTPLDTVEETTRQDRQPRQPPLPPVAERKSEYGMPEPKAQPPAAVPTTGSTVGSPPQNGPSQRSGLSSAPQVSGIPQLPQFGGEPTFGDDFWESAPLGVSKDTPTSASAGPPPSGAPRTAEGLQHAPSLGFRSMVNQAFDQPARSSTGMSHQDSQRSAGDSSVSRSDSAATSDVSPIMSRVPSSAGGGARLQGVQMRDTPTIAEEPAEIVAPEPQRRSDVTLAEGHQLPRKPSPNSRSSSANAATVQPGYRRDLRTPSPNNSPARTPTVEENKQLPHSEAAELAMNSPAEESGVQVAPLAAAATAGETGETHASGVVAVTEPISTVPTTQQAKDSIADSRNKDLPPIPPQQESDFNASTNGNVQDLADPRNTSSAGIPRNPSPVKQDATVESSLPEKTSMLEPPTQPSVERPGVESAQSFRPRLPGQWESFATSASDQSEHDTAKEVPPVVAEQQSETTPTASQPEVSHPESDKTPTSPAAPMQSLADEQSATQHSNPVVALAAAGVAAGVATGAAVGAAFKKTVGLNQSEDSTIPTQPPEKDSPQHEEEDIPPPVPLKENSKSPLDASKSSVSPVEPVPIVNVSSDDAPTDFESDRLHKEIVSSLSPIEPSEPNESAEEGLAVSDGDRDTAFNRDSSILPQIYDSYWGDEKEAAPAERSSVTLPEVTASNPEEVQPNAAEPTTSEPPSNIHADTLIEKEDDFGPSATQHSPLMKRFSWEMDDSNTVSPVSPAVVSPAAAFTEGQSRLSVPGDTTPDNPRFSGEGLHVINAAPGEIPPLETTPITARQIEESPQTERQFSPQTEQQFAHETEQQFSSQTEQQYSPPPAPPKMSLLPVTQGVDPKFPSFRDIMAIKSPQQRIDNFNRTREQWAGHDSGLSSWVSTVIAARPEYGDIGSTTGTPLSGPSGGARHKATSSISRAFTKPFNPLSSQGQQETSSPQASGVLSPEATPSPVQRTSGVKGKEFLEKAGALGGKGMTGAKGLFAKGRSKFRGSTGGSEKVD